MSLPLQFVKSVAALVAEHQCIKSKFHRRHTVPAFRIHQRAFVSVMCHTTVKESA